jgi:hypothetical protein
VEQGRFDPLAMASVSDLAPRAGLPAIRLRVRAFVPTELILLFRLAGMTVMNIWGGTAGNWLKKRINLDEIEIMIVAQKSPEPLAPTEA